MASSVMNGRLRSIPTTTTHGESLLVSALLPNNSLSICTIDKQPAATNNNNDPANSNSRSSDGTAAAHVPLHRPDEGGVAVHQSLAEGVSINNIAHHDEVVVDHCWWNISLPCCRLKSKEGCCCSCRKSSTDATNANGERWHLSILAVLARCHNSTPTLNHASSSSSIVRLYFYKNNDDPKSMFADDDGNGRRHIASFPTSNHAIAIAMGGKGLDGVLVISRSSGLELHSLRPISEKYLEDHCWSCGELLLNDNAAISSDDVGVTSTPVRRLKSIPSTPLAPKSLSKAFEDASCQVVQIPSVALTASLPSSNSTKSSQIPLQQPPLIQHVPPIELLPSFCIHALHLSYPYLSIASGDRVGVWCVDSDFLFGDDNVQSKDGRSETHHNLESGSKLNGRKVEEALWATTLPPSSGSKSVHRRVTSMHMTQCGEAMALSCWDGSAFVYVATSGYDTSSLDSLKKSWDLIGEAGFVISSALTRCTPPPRWEQPTSSTDELFPTFVTLSLNNSNASIAQRNRVGGLAMAVSTPGSDRVRCFDIFSGVQCSDILLRETSTTGEIHGMATVSNGQLVWITDKDIVYSQHWAPLDAAEGPNEKLGSDSGKSSSAKIRWMKRTHSLIATSTPANCGRKASKSWLYWHEVSTHSTLSSEIPQPSSSWAVRCQWASPEEVPTPLKKGYILDEGNKFDNLTIVSAAFLTPLDIIDLAEVGSECETAFSTKTQAIITENFFAIIIPSYAMLYVYAREYASWKTMDLEEENIDTCVAAKVVIIDSLCFVLLLDECQGSIELKVWDLDCVFKDTVNQNAPSHCSIPAQQCKTISALDMQPINENFTSFVLMCHANNDKKGLWIWEIKYSDGECVINSDHFISPSSTFPLEWLKPTSIFSLSCMKEKCPEHDDLTILLDPDSNQVRDDLVMHFQIHGSAWLCVPRVNLWRPL